MDLHIQEEIAQIHEHIFFIVVSLTKHDKSISIFIVQPFCDVITIF